jgi:mannose-6-phosphate isomerase-like protein (cupin superfamily)
MTNPIPISSLPFSGSAHAFVGRKHGNVGISLFLVDSKPGDGPDLHKHPYAEVFIVQEGVATFTLGERRVGVVAGNIVVAEPGVPHCFKNTGSGPLKLTAIHGNNHFVTEWLNEPKGPNTWKD